MYNILFSLIQMEKQYRKIHIDWTASKDYGTNISIINFINLNRYLIREKYLKFIKNINTNKIDIDFNYEHGVCMWEMSVIKEMSSYKSNYINEVMKFIALTLVIKKLDPEFLTIKNVNESNILLLKEYFENIKIKYSLHKTSKKNKIGGREFLLKNCPSYIKAVFYWVSHLFKNFYLILMRPINTNIENGEIILLGYLTHLKKEAIDTGKFSSSIWESLPSILKDNNRKPYYIHHYLETKDTNSSKKALDLVKKFNVNERHEILFSFLSFKDYLKILIDFNNLYFRFYNVKFKFKEAFVFGEMNFFNFFIKDLIKSFNGTVLLENIIWINVFKNFFSKQKQKLDVIFIQENQSWEIAMLNYFKKYNDGKIIALQNQSVRFWDLRYNYKYSKKIDCDYYLVNCDFAYDQFVSYGYPKGKIIKVESLCYSRFIDQIIKPEKIKNSVLLLGDYDVDETNKMLDELLPFLSSINYTIGFKPHPAKEIKNEYLYNFNIIIETNQISNLIQKYQFFIVSNKSGSSLDLFYLNEKPIIYLAQNQLSNSPLSEVKNILQTSSKDEILDFFKKPVSNTENQKDQIFYIDKSFKRWNNFMSSISNGV